MTARTDTRRVIDWFREHPGSSRFEAQVGLHGVHVTARMSDARDSGVEFQKWRDDKGVFRYSIAAPERVTRGEQLALEAHP